MGWVSKVLAEEAGEFSPQYPQVTDTCNSSSRRKERQVAPQSSLTSQPNLTREPRSQRDCSKTSWTAPEESKVTLTPGLQISMHAYTCAKITPTWYLAELCLSLPLIYSSTTTKNINYHFNFGRNFCYTNKLHCTHRLSRYQKGFYTTLELQV